MALSNFPIVWIAFKLGASPVSAYIVYFCVYFLMIFVRLFMVKDLICMSAWTYIKEVFLRVFVVGMASFIFPFIITRMQDDSVLRLFEVLVVSVICSVISILTLGMKKDEKEMVFGYLRTMFHRK